MTTQIERQSRHGFNAVPMPANHQLLNERASHSDKTWVIRDIINQLVHNRNGVLHDRDHIIRMGKTIRRLIAILEKDLSQEVRPEVIERLKEEIIGKLREEIGLKQIEALEQRVERLEKENLQIKARL